MTTIQYTDTHAQTHRDRYLALLIDAETIPPRYMPLITARVLGRHGIPLLRRVYGDWGAPHLAPWKKYFAPYELDPIARHRTWARIDGSPHAEPALAQDAIELLDNPAIEGLCIAACGARHAGIATLARQRHRLFVGFGLHGTRPSYAEHCDEFVLLDRMAGAA